MSVCYPTSMKIKEPPAEEQEKVPKLGAEGEVGFSLLPVVYLLFHWRVFTLNMIKVANNEANVCTAIPVSQKLL